MTFEDFRLSEMNLYPDDSNDLNTLVGEIARAGIIIHNEISKGSLGNLLEDTEVLNASGETVTQLDEFANNVLVDVLKSSSYCVGLVSEEIDNVEIFDNRKKNQSQYIVMFDPLDGSSNIHNCLSTGTIFGIYKKITSPYEMCRKEDFLQSGNALLAAGYIIYGASTMMVYATKRGVNGFTLDYSKKEFYLSHRNMTCPVICKYYSVNDSKIFECDESIIRFIRSMQGWNADNPGSFNSRYVGSLVADLHRTLVEGGIFLYPATESNPNGKLRLMYECNPFAFIFQVAGGAAINGAINILDIQPHQIHQRSPLFVGSQQMVSRLMRGLNKFRYATFIN